MSPTCPHRDEWLRLADGELTENRAAALRAHAASCPACAGALARHEALLRRLAAPVPGAPSPGAVAALLERLDAAPPAPARRPQRYLWGGAAGLAAAAALALVVLRLQPPAAPGRGDFTPRGEAAAWAARVGVELWAVESPLRRLAPGGSLAPGAAVVAVAANGGDAAAYLLAFALDARGEVHWLYPAWLDSRTDPASVELEPRRARQVLGDGAILDGLPSGPVQLVTVVTRTPLAVSTVERLAPAEREPGALRVRWPDARVEAVSLRIEGAPERRKP